MLVSSLTVRSVHTRFLLPFFFDPSRSAEAAAALCAEAPAALGGPLWQPGEPPALYGHEVLPHVTSFLFGAEGDECHYLTVPAPVADRLWKGATVSLDRGDRPVALDRPAGMELFLTEFGVGLLSIALTTSGDGLDQGAATDWNYRLAQLRPRQARPIRLAHPRDDAARWDRIPEAQRARIADPPAEDAPLDERLGRAGGVFRLPDLIEALLAPLAAFGRTALQTNLSVYTVARLPVGVDFALPADRETVGPFLAALAQVEEAEHAGALADALPVADVVLNRQHRAAAGQVGAAHVVVDQPPPDGHDAHPFDTERVPRVLLKYFVPYLMALLQRLTLHRVIADAGAVVRRRVEDTERTLEDDARALAPLRDALLRFSIAGHFTQLSVRDALHRFYELARRGLDVPDAWDEVRRTFAELDARLADHQARVAAAQQNEMLARQSEVLARQSEQSTSMAKHLRVIARVQTLVEWIEVFLVSVYAAHLYEMSIAHVTSHDWEWLHHPGMVLGVAGLAAVVAMIAIRPWHGRHELGEAAGDPG